MANHKTDQEFFADYCACANVFFNNGEDEVAFIKNSRHEFSYLSPQYLKNLSPHGTVVIDAKQDHNEIQKAMHEIIFKQDEEIRQTLKNKTCLYIDIYDRIGIIRKYPIINPDTNNFIGTIGLISPFAMPNILATIYKINGIKLGNINNPPKIN